jgi:hypothetical protein
MKFYLKVLICTCGIILNYNAECKGPIIDLIAKTNNVITKTQALADIIEVFFIQQNISFDFHYIGPFTIELKELMAGVQSKISAQPRETTTTSSKFYDKS